MERAVFGGHMSSSLCLFMKRHVGGEMEEISIGHTIPDSHVAYWDLVCMRALSKV